MMRQSWSRIVNVTTSLGTMLNAGSPLQELADSYDRSISTMRRVTRAA